MSPLAKKKDGKIEKSFGNWKDEQLGMSLVHREPDTQVLYSVMWRVAPSSLCFSSTTQRLPFNPGLAWGKLELFCSGRLLAGAVKAVTVWAFIWPEKRKGKRDRGRGRRRGKEGPGWEERNQRRVWTQTALLTGTPKEGEDEKEEETGQDELKARTNLTKSQETSLQLRHCCYSHTPPSLSLSFFLSALSISPSISSLFSSITSFLPSSLPCFTPF